MASGDYDQVSTAASREDDDWDIISISSSDSSDSDDTIDTDHNHNTRASDLCSDTNRNQLPRLPFATIKTEYKATTASSRFQTLKIGDTVELRTDVADFNSNYNNDFLRIRYIIKEVGTQRIYLRGWRLRRNALMDGRITPTKLNEVTLLVDRDLDDGRPALEQGMVTIPVEYVLRRRKLIITNREFPIHSWREHTSFSSAAQDAEQQKNAISCSSELVCRWVHMSEFSDAQARLHHYRRSRDEGRARVPRTGTIRRITAEESDPGFSSNEALILFGFAGYVRGVNELQRQYTYAEVCCGGGFTSMGAQRAGLKIHYAVDHNPNAAATYRLNFPEAEVYEMDVADFIHFISFELHHVDILHISFPCQFFSPAHTQAGPNDDANTAASFALRELLRRIKPRIVTLEQTSGLLTHHPEWFQAVLAMLTDEGCSASWSIINCADYGLCHNRKRLIITAACPGTTLPPRMTPTHGPGAHNAHTTIADALAPLTTSSNDTLARVSRHNPRAMPRLNLQPYPADSQLRRTITCGGTTESHPSGIRKFTVRELTLMQSAPLDFSFPPDQANTAVVAQIGNAFPTAPAQSLFKTVIRSLREQDRRNAREWAA